MSSLAIDLIGGRIKTLKCKNREILGTFERIDGKLGNTHVCVPNFGEEGKELGLPFHGPFRNIEWKNPKKSTPDPSFDKEGNLLIFAENLDLRVTQKFSLKNGFEHKVLVENIGKEAKPVNVVIHNYFRAPKGFEGMKINGVEVSEIVKKDDYFAIKERNEIEIKGQDKLFFEVKGFNYVRLWTGRKEIDGNLVFDETYVCIEPVIGKGGYFGSRESLLEPGEIREVRQKVMVLDQTQG